MSRSRVEPTELTEALEELPPRSALGPRPQSTRYRVRVARTDAELAACLNLRSEAFRDVSARLSALLLKPEVEDQEPGGVVLLAQDTSSGETVGTIRAVTNWYRPIEFERHLELPDRFSGACLAQVSRLCVSARQSSSAVTWLLLKAVNRYCEALQVRFAVVSGRRALARMYEGFGFSDVFPGREFLLPSSGDLRVRVMAFDFADSPRVWRESNPRVYDFMVNRLHREIEVFDSVAGARARPRTVSQWGSTPASGIASPTHASESA